MLTTNHSNTTSYWSIWFLCSFLCCISALYSWLLVLSTVFVAVFVGNEFPIIGSWNCYKEHAISFLQQKGILHNLCICNVGHEMKLYTTSENRWVCSKSNYCTKLPLQAVMFLTDYCTITCLFMHGANNTQQWNSVKMNFI